MRYVVQFGQDRGGLGKCSPGQKSPKLIDHLPPDITHLEPGDWKYSYLENGGLGGWVGIQTTVDESIRLWEAKVASSREPNGGEHCGCQSAN